MAIIKKGDATMMKSNFERWLRIPQLTTSHPSPLRRAALAGAASRRPARLAMLIGVAAFCASLAMTAAPAGARPVASAGVDSTEPGRLAMDEFSSRRHGAGSRPAHAGRSHAGRSKGGGAYRNLRFGHQHVGYGTKVGLFQKGTKGFVTGVHRGQKEPSRHRNASLGQYGDGKFKKHTRHYTAGPSYETRGHKRRTLAGRQPDGGYSYGDAYYRQKSAARREHYASDKRVKW
jgi:hypothetical protein